MAAALSELERDLLTWVLPQARSAYAPYRHAVMTWGVAARSQRGDGHIVLAPPGGPIDLDMPLPQVLAYGVLETSEGSIAVTVRERVAEQLDCDVSSLSGKELPHRFTELRRWSYSDWSPGKPCPMCADGVREVCWTTVAGAAVTLGICQADRRLWVFDSSRELAIPIPVTSFYNELMRVRRIRDPEIALNPDRFYSSLPSYSDAELTEAFVHYNALRPKLGEVAAAQPPTTGGSRMLRFVRNLLGKSQSSSGMS